MFFVSFIAVISGLLHYTSEGNFIIIKFMIGFIEGVCIGVLWVQYKVLKVEGNSEMTVLVATSVSGVCLGIYGLTIMFDLFAFPKTYWTALIPMMLIMLLGVHSQYKNSGRSN